MGYNNQIIEACFSEIGRIHHYGDPKTWGNKVYVDLSDSIYSKTKIAISPKTLKRLTGKEKYSFTYRPQIYTLDVLAKFLDYPDWNGYEKAIGSKLSDGINHSKKYRSILNFKNKRIRLLFFSLFIVAYLAIRYGIPQKEEFTFEVSTQEGITPLSVNFTYDVSNIRSDNIQLDFGNQKERISLTSPSGTIIQTYMTPIYATAKLFVDGKSIAERNVYAKSKGWDVVCITETSLMPAKYQIIENKYLQIEEQDIQSSEIGLPRKNFWTKLIFYEDLDVVVDDLTVESRVLCDTTMPEIKCKNTGIEILGKNGRIHCFIANDGCLKFIKVIAGEVRITDMVDLSKFTTDLNLWRTLRISLNNNQVSFYIEDKQIHTINYKENMGQFLGISIRVSGRGLIEYIKINSTSTKQLLHSKDFVTEN